MSKFAVLPIILVSAKSEAAASHIISEIIDNEPPELTSDGEPGRVWRITNKYYSADVRLLGREDGVSLPTVPVEGHIIYLTEDECTVEMGERRLDVGAGAAVRVLACETQRMPAALRDWAARCRLEPVALHVAPAAPGDDAEPCGATAVRAALHAHVWPGLRLVRASGPPRPVPVPDGDESDSSDGGPKHEDSDSEEWSEHAVERAERWAAALGRLDDVRALAPPERRAAAEALVTALCHALGHDLEAL